MKDSMITLSGPDLLALREAFKELPKNVAATVIGAGLKRAAQPGLEALKRETPKGPTGNLRRAIKIMVKKYPRDGAAVALVGYVKEGSGASSSARGGSVKKGADRAFHQYWLEFGTDERYVGKAAATPYVRSSAAANRKLRKGLGAKQAKELKQKNVNVKQQGGFIASSFSRLGPFRFTTSKQGFNKGRMRTSPQYPKAFFLKSKHPIRLRPMTAQQPVKKAYYASKAAVSANLTIQMRIALDNGRKIVADAVRRREEMNWLAKYL